MDIISSFSNHPILKVSTEVQEICKPLKKYHIDCFIYSKTYLDRSHIFLTTNPEWSEHYIPNVYNLNYLQNHLFQETVEANYLISAKLYPQNPVFTLAEKRFGVYHGFLMPFLDGPLREVCYFGTTNPNPNICNFYLQNIDALKMFKTYFTEKASKLIKKIEQDKLPSISKYLKNKENFNIQDLLPLPDEIKKQLISEIKTDRYYLINDSEGRYLTKAEYNCAVWLLKGKSSKEIGIIAGVSHRTIEAYIANMKYKFKCSKITYLIYKLIKLGLIV